MDWLIPLISLSAMEIVLGIDNIVFIAILVGKLPKEQQASARRIGLLLALGARLGLLFALSWIMRLTEPFFYLSDLGIPKEWLLEDLNGSSGKDVILLGGGLFLIGKSTFEIHDKLEGPKEKTLAQSSGRYGMILFQIIILDMVFSLDSVITAVGMAQHISVMVIAMVIAVGVMLAFSGSIASFVMRHPTMKILALSFLLLIGVVLIADGLGQHVSKGYIYFAMAFSFLVELLNMRIRAKAAAPVVLHNRFDRESA